MVSKSIWLLLCCGLFSFVKVLKFVELFVGANKVNILSTDIDSRMTRSYVIPVDSKLQRLTIAVSGEDCSLLLRDPNGNNATTIKGLTELLKLKSALSVAVKSPQAGLWNLTVTSSSRHTLRVTGLSSLDFKCGFSLVPTKDISSTFFRPTAGQC